MKVEGVQLRGYNEYPYRQFISVEVLVFDWVDSEQHDEAVDHNRKKLHRNSNGPHNRYNEQQRKRYDKEDMV